MIEELEALPESYGKDRTMLFLRNFEEVDKKAIKLLSSIGFGSGEYKPSYDNLDFFLEKIGYPPTIKMVTVNKYVFTLSRISGSKIIN